MSVVSLPGSLFRQTRDVKTRLFNLKEGIRAANKDDRHLGAVEENLDNFALWAWSLGALQEPAFRISLDYRLLQAPRIAVKIHRCLNDLQEALDDLRLAKLGNDRDSVNLGLSNDEPSNDEPSNAGIGLDRFNIGDASNLLLVVAEYIDLLFAIGVLARRWVPVGQFQLALQDSDPLTPPWVYINHVKDNYPKLARADTEWLAKRLGSASAKRKHFITSCIELYGPPQSCYSVTSMEGLRGKGVVMGQERQSADDSSSTTTATMTCETDSNPRLPNLADLSPNGEPFTCPICRGFQVCGTEEAWRIHVFDDLQAYVCTVKGPICEGELFGDRDSWFNHELRHHRSSFDCELCDETHFNKRNYSSVDSISSHITAVHGYSPGDDELAEVVDDGMTTPTLFNARDCPFCDEWATAIQYAVTKEENREPNESDTLVTAAHFKRHVAAHQERLAIFVAQECLQGGKDDQDSRISTSQSPPQPRMSIFSGGQETGGEASHNSPQDDTVQRKRVAGQKRRRPESPDRGPSQSNLEAFKTQLEVLELHRKKQALKNFDLVNSQEPGHLRLPHDVQRPQDNWALQDYEHQLMLLEQQKLKREFINRLAMVRAEQGASSGSPSPAMQDYEKQLRLLEQQNKRRRELARNEDMNTDADNPALPDYMTQLAMLEEKNKRRLAMARAEQDAARDASIELSRNQNLK